MIYEKNLEDLIINRHKENGANKLLILSGWIGFKPIEKISKKNINTTIIYGCYSHKKPYKFHSKYKELNNLPNINILYSSRYNHSKIYCWLNDNKVIDVLAGSANFSNSGLNTDYGESLFVLDKEDRLEAFNIINEMK